MVSSLKHSIKPDIVHAHSSWAGVYTRLLPSNVPLVYEPHCFKFDDPTVGPIRRFALRTAESILSIHTDAFAVLSAHEEQLAIALKPKVATVRLPNVPSIQSPIASANTSPWKLVMVGRLCDQKDPHFFLEVVEELRGIGSTLTPIWIGDGDAAKRDLLTRSGVRVTGWLDGNQLVNALQGSIYCHSASYEGFPLSVLDAAQVGTPVVARGIPAFQDTGIEVRRNPKELAILIEEIHTSQENQARLRVINAELLTTYNSSTLRQRLFALYKGLQP